MKRIYRPSRKYRKLCARRRGRALPLAVTAMHQAIAELSGDCRRRGNTAETRVCAAAARGNRNRYALRNERRIAVSWRVKSEKESESMPLANIF